MQDKPKNYSQKLLKVHSAVTKMKVDEYYDMQASCDDKCYVTDDLIDERNFMKCVTCPFCKELVNAILTESTISCPLCRVKVER